MTAGRGVAAGMTVSVIIPTLDEATTIVGALEALASQGADEVIVVDAGSADGTAALAEGRCHRVLCSARGRGAQQNLGASVASGRVLLFLHADCRLADGALDRLRDVLARNPRVPGGCYRMRVASDDPRFRPVDAAAHLRAGVLGIPYGDQGIFATRRAFDRAGGFPETRLMDDVLFALRLRRQGRLVLLPDRIDVSPRRWVRRGIVRQTLRNWALTALAAGGVSPDRLATLYPTVR